MAKRQKLHKYPFLDTVIDVFYSIILYSTFTAFPGVDNIGSLLMVFAVFVMIDYWWTARSLPEIPKYYMIDFYFVTIIMFIFSQWSNYFKDVTGFLLVFVIFLFVDSIYSSAVVYAHKEKEDEPALRFYSIGEFALGLIYFAELFLIKSLTPASVALIFAPYVIWVLISFKMGPISSVCLLRE